MKNFLSKFKWFILGGIIFASAGLAYAYPVSVPNSPSKGAYLSGLANGNYQVTATCANGQILAASSTATSGWACVTNTAALGATTTITSNVLINGPSFTFATSSVTGLNLNITGSGSTITFSPQLQAGYNIPLTASTTQWTNFYNASSTFLTSIAPLIANGTVAGVNATSSTVSFNVQGSGNLNPFNVASSSGTSLFLVAANGSTTISSLGTGSVFSTSGGALYVVGNTGTGLNVLQTSPTLVTPILGVASGTALSLSGSLWTNIQSGTQCVHALASGLLAGTGSDCGSGGSGNSAWTIGNGLIYNATSTDLVGIGTITPTTSLFVQGKGGTNPFTIASSTGTALVTVQQNGNTGIQTTPCTSIQLCVGGTNGSGGIAIFGTAANTAVYGLLSAPNGYGVEGNGNNISLGAGLNSRGVTGLNAGYGVYGQPASSANFGVTGGYFTNNGSGTYSLLTGSGNVGINTTTPAAQLDVYGSGTTNPFNVSSSSNASIFNVSANSTIGINTTTTASEFTLQGTAGYTNSLFTIASSSGGSVLTVTPASGTYNLIQAGTTTAGSLFVVTSLGDVDINHLVGSTTLPTIATSTGDGAAAGTATITANGTDLGFQVTAVTGNAPAANKPIWTATFSRTFASAPNCSLTSNTSTPSFIEDTYLTTSATSTTLWSSTTTLTGTSTYESTQICVGSLGG